MPNLLINNWICKLAFALIVFANIGCYEPESACLDLLANNYDVSADNDCQDCCTYPSIVIEMDHLWQDTSFRFGDTLTNNLGSSFLLLDQKFYLSNWTYHLSDGSSFKSRDSISLFISENEEFFKKDIVIVRQNQSTISNHTYRREGTLEACSFTLGVSDALNEISSEEAEEYSPLNFDNDLYIDQAFQSHWLQLGIGPTYSDTVNLYFDEDIAFSSSGNKNFQKGENISIPLTLIYDTLFSNISFEMSSANEIKNQIRVNKTNWIR